MFSKLNSSAIDAREEVEGVLDLYGIRFWKHGEIYLIKKERGCAPFLPYSQRFYKIVIS